MGEKQESMTVDEYLKRSQEITVIGSLEATEDRSRVKLTLCVPRIASTALTSRVARPAPRP
jgi:hypothetical protein